MTNAERLDEVMGRAGDRAKAVGRNGTGERIIRDETGYTLYHIEDRGDSYNPSPLLEGGTAEEAARIIGTTPVTVEGRLVSLRSRKPLAEILGY